MFTGLIKEIGTVKQITRPNSQSIRFLIQCSFAGELMQGASVCISGACHTVLSAQYDCFWVEASPETLTKTNLGSIRIGSKVNLEPALTMNQGLDGHLVQGHVDGTGRIKLRKFSGTAIIVTISAARQILQYLAPKGSVAIDGVSLTVVNCYADSFSVCLIPFSARHTTLGDKQVGAVVNLETDIISKYVAKHLTHRL